MFCFSLDKFNTAASILEETEDWFTHENITLKRKYIANLIDQISWGSEARGQRMLPALSREQSGAQSVIVMRDNIARMKRMWATLDLKVKPVMDWLGNPDIEYIFRLVEKVAERSLQENRRSLMALVGDIYNMSTVLMRSGGSSSGQEETKKDLEERLINVMAAILKAIKKLQSTTNRVEKQQEKSTKGLKRKRKSKGDDDSDMKDKKTRRR